MHLDHPRPKTLAYGLLTAGVTAGAVALLPGVAAAHIAPQPAAVEAGSAATVEFLVEHGCGDSPTTELRFQLPDDVTDAEAVAKDGWTTSVNGGVVTFNGNSLDAHTSTTFGIAFTAPAEATTIYFPVVQKCDTGETAWIQLPVDGEGEPERPAPAVEVTQGPPTSEEVVGAEDDDGDSGDAHEGHHASEPSEEASNEEGAAETEGGGSSGISGGLIAAGVVAVVIVGGTALLVSRRKDTTG